MSHDEERVLEVIAKLFLEFRARSSSFSDDDSLEYQVLKVIPVLAKSRISDVQRATVDITKTLDSVGFKFYLSNEYLTALKKDADSSKSVGDRFCFIVFFHILSMSYVTPELCTVDVFQLAIQSLTTCITGKYPEFVDLCFYSLLHVACSTLFPWTNECVNAVFSHLMANKNLTNLSYCFVVKFFMTVSTMGEAFTDEIFRLLIKMYTEQRHLVKVEKPGPMLNFIIQYLKALDSRAFAVLTLMSKMSFSSAVATVFGNLPIFVGEKITQYGPVYLAPKSDNVEVVEASLAKVGYDFEFVEKRFVTFPDGLMELPRDLRLALVSPYSRLCDQVKEIVMNVAGFLSKSSRVCFDAFFDGFEQLLKDNKSHRHFFDWYCAFLFLLNKSNAMKDKYFSTIIDERLFDSQVTVFNVNALDVTVNSFRTEALSGITSSMLIQYLKSVKDSPLMFTESLGRILDVTEHVFEIARDPLLSDVWNLSVTLQQMDLKHHSESIACARSTLFAFIFRVSVLDNFDMYSSELSTMAYFRFLFEEDIQDYILIQFSKSVRESTNTTHIVPFFITIFQLAKENPRFLKLSEKIITSVNAILEMNPTMAVFFESLLEPLLPIVRRDNESMTRQLLAFLYPISRSRACFELSHNVMEKLMLVTPPTRSFLELLTRLIGTKTSAFTIEYHTFLPLLCSVYEESELLSDVIGLFSGLSDYSAHNRLELHRGEVDLFLIKLLSKEQSRVPRKRLLSLLIEICTSYCNFEVTTAFVEFLISSSCQEEHLLRRIISKCSRFGFEKDSIGSLPPFYRDVLGDDCVLDNFVITFGLKMDVPMIIRTNVIIPLITFTDFNSNRLVLFVNGSEMYCQFQQENVTNSALIFDDIEAGKWHNFTLSFTEETADMFTVLAKTKNEMESTTQIKRVSFTSPIEIELGGCRTRVPHHWANVVMGFVSSFSLKDGSGREVIRGRDSNCWKQTTLNRTIVDCLALNPACIRSVFKSKGLSDEVLVCLKELFAHDVQAQLQFRCDCEFIDTIKKSKIDFHLYLMLYSVFDAITDQLLRSEWLERVLVNIWIWIMCEVDDLVKIFRHWNTVLKQNMCLFRVKSYFTDLLTEVGLFFPFSDERNQNISIHEHTRQEREMLRALFVQFVKRVAHVNLSSTDVTNLVQFCLSARTSNAQACYLEFVRDCAKLLITVKPDELDLVRTIACFTKSEFPNVTSMSLQAIHELDSVYLHRYTLMLFSKNSIQNSPEVLDQLMDDLPRYPNLVPLVSLLALNINNANTLAKQVAMSLFSNSFIAVDFWYVAPVLFCAKLDEMNQWRTIDAIVDVFARQPDFRNEISPLFHFFSLITANTDLDLPFQFLRSVTDRIDLTDSLLVQECFVNLARALFFHVSHRTHSRALLMEFATSPFQLPSSFANDIMKIQTPECQVDLSHLVNVDLSSLSFNYELRLDDSGTVLEELKTKRALALGLYVDQNNGELQKLRQIISYFARKKQMSVQQKLVVLKEMENVLREVRHSYRDEFIKTNSTTVSKLQTNLESIQLELDTLVEFSESNRPELTFLVDANTTEILKKSKFMNFVKISPRLVRDNSVCSLFCPMKFKMFSRHNDSRSCHARLPYSFEIACKCIRRSWTEYGTFRIGDNELIILSSTKEHLISFDEIHYVFERGSYCIEIFTDLGRSFYLDFSPNLSETVISRIPMEKLTSLRNEHLTIDSLKSAFLKQKLSNFEFLMKVNILCGRSFNIPSKYPIFPSILSEFDSLSRVRNIASVTAAENPSLDIFEDERSSQTLKNCVCDTSCLAPEFFCVFDLPIPESQLPEWASDVYEFVYQHRKLLEKPSIKHMLPDWIEKVHKVSCSKPVDVIETTSTREIAIETEDERVVFADVVKENSKELLYVMVLSDGHILFLSLPLASEQNATIVAAYKESLPEGTVCRVFGEVLHVYDPIKRVISKFSALKKLQTESLMSETAFWAESGRNLVYCETSTSLRINTDLYFTSSKIHAFCASFEFRIVVLATIDGVVTVVSMKNHRKVKSVRLDGQRVLEITITPALGFIIALTAESLWVMDVNGTVLRKNPRSRGMRMLSPFRGSDGIDYVAFVDGSGNVGAFEAFYPENISCDLCEVVDPVSLRFSRLYQSIVTTTPDGVITIAPVSLS